MRRAGSSLMIVLGGGCLHCHLRFLWFNRGASILLSWSLVQGALGRKNLLGVCQIVAGLELQRLRSIGVELSCVAQVTMTSTDKLWPIAIG